MSDPGDSLLYSDEASRECQPGRWVLLVRKGAPSMSDPGDKFLLVGRGGRSECQTLATGSSRRIGTGIGRRDRGSRGAWPGEWKGEEGKDVDQTG